MKTQLALIGLGCALVASALGCGSSTSPSNVPTPGKATTVTATDIVVDATFEKWVYGTWDIAYGYCFSLKPGIDAYQMKYSRAEYTTLGPGGEVYESYTDQSLVGHQVGLGQFGCFHTFRDYDLERPIATSYRMSFAYGPDGNTSMYSHTATGAVKSKVPPKPYMGSVTLTDDLGPVKELRQRRPVTFTVTKVDGGTPPYLYQWRLNGAMLRDWDPNPSVTWDGQTGSSLSTTSHSLVVSVRRSTWPEAESGESLHFFVWP